MLLLRFGLVERGCTLGEVLASERSGYGGEVLFVVALVGESEIEFRSSDRGGIGRPPEVLSVLGIGSESMIGGGGWRS